MPPLPQTTAAALARRAKELLRDAAELTSGRDPNYIRDAQPDSLFEAIPLAAARQGCRRYADKPDQYSGLRQARVERACRPYLDSLEYGEPPSLIQPFEGGQCSDLRYNITGTYTSNQTDVGGCGATRTWVASGVFGPIGGITKAAGEQQGWRVQGGISAVNCVDQETGRQLIDVPECGDSVGNFVVRAGRPVISSVTPLFGEPDVCGDRPPEFTPPAPPVLPGPPVERYNPRPDIDVNIGVEVNIDGSINVDFGTGPITIDPFGDEGEGGGGGEGPPPGDVGNPGETDGTGNGGEAEGEAPEGTVLTGLRIDFAEPPIGGNEYAAGVYRGVCYIYMGTQEGLDHDPAGAMLRSGQFVFAEKDNLTRWRVSANDGYSLNVTPYYRPVEAEG